MTKKASEPRTLMKVPISFRDRLQGIAQANKTSMIEEVQKLLPKEAGAEASKQPTPTATPEGAAHDI